MRCSSSSWLAPGRAGRGIKRPSRIKRPPGLGLSDAAAALLGEGPVHAVELRAEYIIKARSALATRGRAALCKGGGAAARCAARRRRKAAPLGAFFDRLVARARVVADEQKGARGAAPRGNVPWLRREQAESQLDRASRRGGLRERKRGALRDHWEFCEDMRDGVRAAETVLNTRRRERPAAAAA